MEWEKMSVSQKLDFFKKNNPGYDEFFVIHGKDEKHWSVGYANIIVSGEMERSIEIYGSNIKSALDKLFEEYRSLGKLKWIKIE